MEAYWGDSSSDLDDLQKGGDTFMMVVRKEKKTTEGSESNKIGKWVRFYLRFVFLLEPCYER